MATQQLNEQARSRCVRRLGAALEHPGIATAVLASTEGLQLAAPDRSHGIDTMHVAVAGARISAVGRSLAGSPERQGVSVCDLAGSPMVVVPVGPALLIVIGRPGANIGMVAGTARDTAQAVTPCVSTMLGDRAPTQERAFAFDAEGFTARVLQGLEEERRHGRSPGEA